jgi:hypothetical protein
MVIRQVVKVALVTNSVYIDLVAQGILHVIICDARGRSRVEGLITAKGWYSDADLCFTSTTAGETDPYNFRNYVHRSDSGRSQRRR